MRVAVALFAAVLLVQATAAQRLERSTDAMGATFSVVLYGSDQDSMNQAIDAAFDEAHRLDAQLSNYRPESEWSHINREAGSHPVVVSPELFRLLSKCKDYSRASEGTFDLTVGPLMRAWGFLVGDRHVPSPDQIHHALARIGGISPCKAEPEKSDGALRSAWGRNRPRRRGQGLRRRSHGRDTPRTRFS